MRKRGRGTKRIVEGSPFIVSLRTAESIYEGGQGQTAVLSLPVDRSGNMGYPGSVQWGVSGYGPTPATVNDFGGAYPSDFIYFGNNDTTININITIYGNDVEDGDRVFRVSLNAPQTTGGSGIAAIGVGEILCTIIDDDAPQPTSETEYGTGNPAYYGADPTKYGD